MVHAMCCVCGFRVGEHERGSMDIFAVENLSSKLATPETSLAQLLTKILNKDVSFLMDTELHKVCRNCKRLVLDIRDLEFRLNQMKAELSTRFNATVGKLQKLDPAEHKQIGRKVMVVFKEKNPEVPAPSFPEPMESPAAIPKNSLLSGKSSDTVVQSDEMLVPDDKMLVAEEYRDLGQPDGTFKCRFCKRKFIDLASALHHMVDYHKGVSVRCSICDESFRSITELRRHKMDDHPGFSDTNTFQVNDLVLRNVICNRCDRQFPNFKSLNAHVKMCHIDGVSADDVNILNLNFTCNICEFLCGNQEELVEHLNEDHWVDRPYCCHMCLQAYKSREEYSLHVKHKHQGKHVCSRCMATLNNEKEYEFHVKDHFKRPQLILECKYCILKFTEKELLDDHVHLKHGDIDKDECVFISDEPALEVELEDGVPSSGLEHGSCIMINGDSYEWHL